MGGLDERKRSILKAVTDSYIDTAEPVGSTTIARKHKLGISSATIRNEMASLEEIGYLYQPHTSAGRVPSDKGYRYYVDTLLKPFQVTSEENRRISELSDHKKDAIEKIIRRSTRILAELTEYISVAVIPVHQNATFRHIQLVSLDQHNILAVLVVDPGIIENKVLFSDLTFTPDELDTLSSYLNKKLRGKRGEALTRTMLNELKGSIPGAEGLLSSIIGLINQTLKDHDDEVIIADGIINLLDQPEFKNIDKTKLVLNMFENQGFLAKLLFELSLGSGVKVHIGEENQDPELKEFSLVTATYYHNGLNVGTIGVMGPTRMAYGRAISLVSEMAFTLSDLLELF